MILALRGTVFPRRHAVPHPNGGVADSLDEAKATFLAAWEAGG